MQGLVTDAEGTTVRGELKDLPGQTVIFDSLSSEAGTRRDADVRLTISTKAAAVIRPSKRPTAASPFDEEIDALKKRCMALIEDTPPQKSTSIAEALQSVAAKPPEGRRLSSAEFLMACTTPMRDSIPQTVISSAPSSCEEYAVSAQNSRRPPG